MQCVQSKFFLPVLFGVLAATGAHAASWTGNGPTQSWDDPANWGAGGVPNGAVAEINAGTTESDPALITNGVTAAPTDLYVGSEADCLGHLRVEAGGVLRPSGATYLGRSGVNGTGQGNGTLVNRGGSIFLREVRVGSDRGNANTPYGHGSLIHESGTLVISNIWYFGIGGDAHFKADADFTALGITYFGYRGNADGVASQTMELGAVTASFQNITMAFNQTDRLDGKIILRGTTLNHAAASGNSLIVRGGPNAAGVLRGWGTVQGGALLNNGKIIADGEGVARDLDLRYYYATTNLSQTTVRDNTGWYAVNKGRMLFREFTQGAGNFDFCAGDREVNWNLYAANSARVTLNGMQAGQIKPSLLAPDHPDAPETGFPLAAVKSVWNFETPAFASASIIFRYDETSVRDVSLLRVLRYNPASQTWGRVAATHDAATLRFTTASLAPQGGANLGLFALVELPPPTLFLVR